MYTPGWKLLRAGVFRCEAHNPPRRANRVNTLVAVKGAHPDPAPCLLEVPTRKLCTKDVAMPAGQSQIAKRALVAALLALAVAYGVSLSLSRDSPDGDVLRGYRRESALERREEEEKRGKSAALRVWKKRISYQVF